MGMFDRFRRKPVVEEEPMPTPRGPLAETRIEKFTLDDGAEVLIYNPRISHYMDGRKVSGVRCDESGMHTHHHALLHMGSVTKRVAMGWDPANAELVEAPELPLPSNR